ncbi:SDR family oxidoreductase [Roseibium sp. MMSF_3544]|uniref:SDR family oxidoreductase n=1 Tax=unclassified Roseibium TaxID=2629323 RepID=UPI0027400159|nr:SDR family oxidoreductase [Roseibium sp. MMSF_3544]
MDLGIRGKTALVLGASQGLGKAIAEKLAEEGANLFLVARSEDKLAGLSANLSSTFGVTVTPVALDLSGAAAVEVFCDRVRNEIKPDILLNNAGGPPPSPSLGVTAEVWHRSAQTLLFSLFRITEATVEVMKARKWGRILAIGSSGVVQPIPNLAVSNTIRGAMAGFCKTLSNEVAGDGITVNMILPGKIDTDRVGQLDTARAQREGKTLEQVRTEIAASLPAKRYGRPEEFASVAVFMLSEPAGYVTGQMTRVDGGMIKSI